MLKKNRKICVVINNRANYARIKYFLKSAKNINRIDLQIIVETHSEYLIRKLQYLSAKHVLQTDDNLSLNPKDISIYYFNSDEYVTDVEPKVKCIHVDVFGGLSDTFGKGFFDEATNLKFQLMNLNKSQSN